MTIIDNLNALMKCNEDDLHNLFKDLKEDIEHKFLTVEDGNEACNLLNILRSIMIIEKDINKDLNDINLIIQRIDSRLETVVDIKNHI